MFSIYIPFIFMGLPSCMYSTRLCLVAVSRWSVRTYVQVYVQSDRRTVPVHELKSLVHELALVYDIKDTFTNWSKISRNFFASFRV